MRALCGLMFAATMCGCDTCHPGHTSWRLKENASELASGDVALLAGGARATLVGEGLPSGGSVKSSSQAVQVTRNLEGGDEIDVVTGGGGSAVLDVIDERGRAYAAFPDAVLVAEPQRLDRCRRLSERLGGARASSARVVAGEKVSLGVVGVAVDNGNETELYGSGVIHTSVSGTLTKLESTNPAGVERVFFVGAEGLGSVEAGLGALRFSYPVTVLSRDALTLTLSLDARLSFGDCSGDGGCWRTVLVDVSEGAYGGACSWSASGGGVEFRDRTAHADRLEAELLRRTDVHRSSSAPVMITCTIGASSTSLLLP